LHYLAYKFYNDWIITYFPTCTLFLPLDFQKYFEYCSSLIFIFYHFLICYQLKNNQKAEHEEIKKIATSSNISMPACVATAMTTMVVGYALGWRGGAWYARRAFRREQQKLMGHMKSHSRWHWRPFNRLKNRLRRASKNKSEDAHRSLDQGTDAPSSSRVSANVSNTAQPAAGSA